ncbi:MAG: alkaline phosphatase [Pyrinomonadaceae bacterium]
MNKSFKRIQKILAAAFLATAFIGIQSLGAMAQGAPTVRIILPERFRVLTNQYFDLRIEAENLSRSTARVELIIEGEEGEEKYHFAGPLETTDNNDNNPNTIDKAVTFRRMYFDTPGIKTIRALVLDGRQIYGVGTQVSVQNFHMDSQKNIVLFIGDAMGTAYRDAGRIVAQSTGNRFREGWFDELQQMDRMPVTGMSMTYSLENIVPDSANTGSAWTTGNKTINGALNVFPDNNDFRFSGSDTQGTKQYVLDNPRVETLWQFLKRRYGYRTGIVTTSDVTDATPAAEGAHTLLRGLGYDIARQYVDGSINQGNQFDVILGGGVERFSSRTNSNSGDTRNLATELQNAGYSYVQNRTELNALNGADPPAKLLGLFRTSHMNVAYDKLGLARPADEPAPNFGGFDDQPFLDEMTDKAIKTLNKDNAPFILMVEGASIDKQSHPNYAAGQLWDTIEFDKSVGVGRTFLNRDAATRSKTLVLVTADHDQSMSIIGAVDTNVPNAVQNVISILPYANGNRPGGGSVGTENRVGETSGFPDYEDANGDRYPENTNRIRIKVGYRTGDHTGSSVPVTAEGAGALLFFGYYDQTDIFFKMAKALTLNTQALDAALQQKLSVDVPYFTPDKQLLYEGKGVQMMRNAPLTQPRLLTEKDHASCGLEDH